MIDLQALRMRRFWFSVIFLEESTGSESMKVALLTLMLRAGKKDGTSCCSPLGLSIVTDLLLGLWFLALLTTLIVLRYLFDLSGSTYDATLF
jgi:hypothetical protein